MNLELEKYIDMALVDGVIAESQRTFLQKKAKQLGVDDDEFEFILNAKIQIKQKELHASSPPPPPIQIVKTNSDKSIKEGDMKKCPSCGAPTSSFATKCPDCGHEFRNIESVSSISKLHVELQKAEVEERNRPRSWAERIDGEMAVLKAVANRQKMIISSFPVPNSRGDLLEFLSIASSEAQTKTGFTLYKNIDPKTIIKQAWRSKCEQIIMKARFSMKDDKITLGEIETYAKQLKL